MHRKSWVVLLSLASLLLAPGLFSPAGALDPVPPVNQTPPAVVGTARVGAALTADPGTWLPEGSSYSYTWLRDGAAIAGASGAMYRVANGDLGHRLAVRVTAHGEASGQPATSAETAAVGKGRFASTARPTISGVRRWGRKLTVKPGAWSPKPTSYRYQWLREDRPIPGATKATYTLKVKDYGKHIAVRVSPRRDFYEPGAVLSFRTGPIGHRVGVRKTFTYSIATRGRITADLDTFAALTAQTYGDPRGWRSAGYSFRRVARGGDFTLVLASSSQMPSFGFPCSRTWSCRVGRNVIINQTRWLHASPAWNAQKLKLRDYRHMVVDHETGHWLGHRHRGCPGKGKKAPVMMQQSKGLGGCRFNPFPLPSERWTSR
ncbi:hypothetical protein ABIE44_003266 [Marmoricola sp. OAE513]|uniref:DUF3152 domain-containing protein n=1 Tax=Marmoricola sp. OAE513 TaxID=2817894 RepID=UPI001AE6464E